MKHRRYDQRTENEMTAIKAVAVASNAPFMVAFKATLGIMVAQMLVSTIFFGGIILIGFLAYIFLS